MARPSKKATSEKIKDQLNRIRETEELLARLNEELQELYSQKDKEDMEALLIQMKESNLTVEMAIELLQSSK